MKRFFVGFLLTITILRTQAQFVTSNLPIVKITTKAAIVNEPKVAGTLEIFDKKTGENRLSDTPTAVYNIGIEYRGSTSQDLFDKKPFGIETRDDKGNNLNISVLGLPAENDWVLITPYNDKSLMRDPVAYGLAKSIGMTASHTIFCEIVVNGNYYGVGFWGEKVKQGKNRVPIANLDKGETSGDDLTGGYIIKLDKTTGSRNRSWPSNYLNPGNRSRSTFIVEYPKLENLADAQFNYIRNYINQWENRLQTGDLSDPSKSYASITDLKSFADYFLINELSRNVDGYRLSSYFYKDKDSNNPKLKMGPVWDYNLAFGNADYCQGSNREGWAYQFNNVCGDDNWQVPFWWTKMLSDKNFVSILRDRWNTLKKKELSKETINKMIDSSANVLKQAQQRNFTRWPVLGKYVWPNAYVGTSYDDEVRYLKQWIDRRWDWLDGTNLLVDEKTILANEKPTENNKYLKIFPNPTNPQSKIVVKVDKYSWVHLRLFDNQGKDLGALEHAQKLAGQYVYRIDTIKNLNKGLIIARLEIDGTLVANKKIMIN